MSKNMKHKSRYLAKTLMVFALGLMAFAGGIFAQTTDATLSGTVSDETGAVIPGAEVTIENRETGLKRTAVTNSSGNFLFPGLKPATYVVTVQKDGFAPVEFQKVTLQTGDRKNLAVQLKIGAVGAEVTVVPEVSTANVDASVSTIVDRELVEKIPTNGRNLQTLITLAPGVVLVPSTDQNAGQFSVNGQRTNANAFSVDGAGANIGAQPGRVLTADELAGRNSLGLGDFSSGNLPPTDATGGFGSLASLDSIEEFQVLTSTYSAESGRQPGAQIRLTTRSGKNKFHGTLFEYFRNDVFDANEFFTNAQGIERPALRYNNFGGTFSGPLPFFNFGEGGPFFSSGKDNLHFFFSYEGKRFLIPQLLPTIDVPSQEERDAETDPTYSAILNSFPLPNFMETQGNQILVRYVGAISNPTTADSYSLRIDKQYKGKHTFFGRYNYSPSETRTYGRFDFNNRKQKSNFFTFGATQVFSQNVVNSFTFNWSKQNSATDNEFIPLNGETDFPSDIFFPNGIGPGERFSLIALTRSFFGTARSGGIITSRGALAGSEQNQINIVDDFSVSFGKHKLKFGGDFRRLTPNTEAQGANISFTTFGFRGESFSQLLRGEGGFPDLQVRYGRPNEASVDAYSFYAQDTWNATKKLTMTMGLRWEINPPPKNTELGNLTLRQAPDLSQLDQSGLELGFGEPLYDSDYTSFAPRFGLAYRLSEKQSWETVLRGGIGIFYDLGQTGFGSTNFPFNSNSSLPFTGFPLAPLPEPTVNPTPSINNRVPRLTIPGENYKSPRTYQWNVTAEQTIGGKQVVTVGYVGSAGRNLVRNAVYTFSPFEVPGEPIYFSPNFSGIRVLGSSGESSYHSLQATYKGRFTEKLTSSVSYTLGRSRDNASDPTINVSGLNPASFKNLDGYSSFDVRHNLTGAVVYQLPSPDLGKFGNALLGGWSLNSVFVARTGFPIDVNISTTRVIRSGGLSHVQNFQQKPNLTGEPIWLFDSALPNGRRLNPAAFDLVNIVDGVDGDFERNSIRGPGMWQIDMGLHKEFGFGERLKVQVRAEAFNIFNHTNFANPTQTFISIGSTGNVTLPADFGRFTRTLAQSFQSSGGSAGQTALFSPGGPRSMQFVLRLSF